MKRKMKKFAEGKAVTTRSDDEIEWASSKPFGGAGQQYPGEGWKEKQKEQGEKNLASFKNFFGGKKDEESESDYSSASRRPRTIEEQIGRKAEDKPAKGIASNFKSSEPKFERNDNEKSLPDVKKAKKAASDDKKPLGDKATPLPGKADDKDKKVTLLPGKDTKATRMPIGYDKLDLSDKEEAPTKGFSTRMGKTDEEREAQAKANRKALSESVSGISKYFRNPFTEEREEKKKSFERKLNAKPTADQMKKMAKGGKVKSASARADGCAIRGKTRA